MAVKPSPQTIEPQAKDRLSQRSDSTPTLEKYILQDVRHMILDYAQSCLQIEVVFPYKIESSLEIMLLHTLAPVLALMIAPLSLAQISDSFEGGWSQTSWPAYAPDCNQGGSVTLDSTTAHGGKNSLRVDGGPNGYCGHIFFGTTKVPNGDVYVRTWLKLKTALTSNHVTFIAMPDGTLAGKHLRLSGQQSVLEYNRESDDATLPDLSPAGIATSTGLPAGVWHCLEYHRGTDGTIETWMIGTIVTGLEVGPKVTNANAQGWTRGGTYVPKIEGVYFGWESYSGDVNTFWYDDVSVAAARVGCS